MRETKQKTIATLVLLAVCATLLSASNARATGQSGARSAVGKGLGNAKPIVIDAQPLPDKDAHLDSGWKLFLVGTNRYDNMTEADDLRYAVKDVESLKSRFIQLGVPQENIVILTTGARGEKIPNKDNIDAAYAKFIAGLRQGDCAFVYLSGHGFRFANNKRTYYAPQDVKVDSKKSIEQTSVSIDGMIDALQNSRANLKWMTVDACRNDPTKYLDDDSAAGIRALEIGVNQHFIVDSNNLPETFIFMQGCEDGQFSIESPELEQGLMTYSLLEALQIDDNPAEQDDSGELNLVDLLSYVQTRTEELAGLCHDRSNTPCVQRPAITNDRLQNATFLTNLRHGGLTIDQWQLITAEEDDFDNYLLNNDFARAEDALQTLVGYYPEGEESTRYQELKKRLEEAQKKPEAEKCYQLAKSALDAKEYAAAKLYIDEALALYDAPEYKRFRNSQLTLAVKAVVAQAIANADATLAKNLNDILIDLDPETAKENAAAIAGLEKRESTPIAGQDSEEDSEPDPGAPTTLNIANIEVIFHWAPAGSFKMGSPMSEKVDLDGETSHLTSERLHDVILTQGFWIAETETTQELWQAVMGNNPSYFKGSKQLPVEKVSWNDCHDFVEKLNSDKNFRNALPDGFKYAMPTEAQWEYACRAGTTTSFNFGDALNGDKANCNGKEPYGTTVKGASLGKTRPVKRYKPNDWGLYDMHGNVAEWCADWYEKLYYTTDSAEFDPTGPDNGDKRVLRGGSMCQDAQFCRSASRYYIEPDAQYNSFGFRLVLVPDSQEQDSKDHEGEGRSHGDNTLRKYPSGDVPETEREPSALKPLTIAGVNVNFHWAPPGKFYMGSPLSEEVELKGDVFHRDSEYQHEVTLTQGFWIAETETTQELWQAVMGNNPSYWEGSNQLPVDQVSWFDCQAFVEKLNSDNNFRSALPSGYKFAMPTEAQWEYACRAGTTTVYSFGDSLNGDNANCDGTKPYGTTTHGPWLKRTSTVASYEPNAWGLYDMHGNVAEWCSDWFGKDYYKTAEAKRDLVGPQSGSTRMIRGGYWGGRAQFCRSADRLELKPDVNKYLCGFRLVLVKDPQAQQSGGSNNSIAIRRPDGDVAESERAPGASKAVTIADVEVVFHWAPPGTFMMGSPASEKGRDWGVQEKQHEVAITRGFWIAETETTQELWQAVMKKNVSSNRSSEKLPVERVSWNSCRDFVETLNRNYADVLPSGYQFAMPTEAQWEYACRAGTTTPFSFGDTLNGDKANCNGNYPYGTSVKGVNLGKTTEVKSYAPNSWGLYDMHGNVAEWCADYFDRDYYTDASAVRDPTGPKDGSHRVLRGGDWVVNASICRSANRIHNAPDVQSEHNGFRLVLVR